MDAGAEHLRHQKRGAAETAADIEDSHIRLECDHAQKLARGRLTAGADEIAPVDCLVLVDLVQAILALVKRGRI